MMIWWEMIYIYLGCLLLVLYYLFSKSNNYWESKGIPFEKPFLFFGSMYNLIMRKESFFETVRAIYKKYKTPYVGIYIFNQRHLLVRSPELLKKILVKDFDKFINRNVAANESVDPISFHSLFSAKDTTWRNIRAKMSPVFTSGKIKLMLPLMKECGRDLTEYLTKNNGETLDTRNVTKKYSVDIISSCAFGINSNCLKNENSEIMKVATKLLNFNTFVRSISVLSFFFIPKFVDIFRLTFGDLTSANYLMNIFKDTLKEREERKIVRHDLIDLLNNLKNNETVDDEYKFDDIKMAAQAITFFAAGNDTTSSTISFALYELALNKEIQDRLRQEVRESFDKVGDFTYESIQEMIYLDMVLTEALRKYPLTTSLNRVVNTDYTFEETGLKLDKNLPAYIMIRNIILIQRNSFQNVSVKDLLY
ncbi:p450 domain containing protein [Asbolus verrucosus]|uniref:p450 domain containing protein n=1 Tax=Asbolus verrucosus TaxID=1661398 RepID=A0A482W7C5_ASBVE|nr:p450 domain containing protein [Asbolus verrucosus]